MYKVRPFRRDDIDMVVALQLKTWKATYRGILPDVRYNELDEPMIAGRWASVAARLAPPVRSAFVAQDDDDLIGAVCIAPKADATAGLAEISSLNTVPERQGEGVGTALVTASMNAARKAGFNAVSLWVVENHGAARGFYESRGWIDTGERAHRSGQGWQAVDARYEICLERVYAGAADPVTSTNVV